MDEVVIDGLRFRVKLDGPEGAPWLVFSNSLGTDLGLWDAQVAAFAGTFRILRYDQRGHGGTAVPEAPATMDRLARDAAEMMERLDVRDAVFVGCSMGAATGFALAPRHPDRVAQLIASDGQAATAPGGAEAWAQRIEAARAGGMDAFAAATVDRWFSARSKAEANPAIARARAMVAATPFGGLEACARALQAYDVSAGLGAIHQPATLIAGAEDGAIASAMRALLPRLPDARFVEIADAGHLPCLERPEAFNAALADAVR